MATIGNLAVPFVAEAQQAGRVYRIGYLASTPNVTEWTIAFVEGLRDLGYVEGQNIIVERRFSEGRVERFPALVAELLMLKVDLIVAVSAPETTAAKHATRSTPILFLAHGDPIGTGDVASFSRPGGNVTGFTEIHSELTAKQLDLLRELAPGLSRVAVLWNAANPAKARDWRELKAGAQTLSISLQSLEIRRPADLDGTLGAIRKQRPDALVILADPLTYSLGAAITDFAAKERLPAMYQLRGFVEAGGLISYAGDRVDAYRRVA